MVLPTSVKLIDDVRKASDDILSASEPFREFLQTDYTLNFLNCEDTYHRDVIRSRLTRNVATTFDQVYDELDGALREYIPATCEEWAKLSILPTVRRIICRASNRIFVGTPLCRNHDYQTLMLDFNGNFVKSAILIGMFPKPLKPIVARLISNIPSQVRSTMEFIRPLVEERFAKMEEFGETWDDAPNDMLMWLMSEAKGIERSLEGLARRLLLANFASIHSTSLLAMQALYRLLSNAECIEPLRQEVETVVAKEGWTKAGMDKMHKVDSFLRETLRVDSLGIVMSIRLALRPFTFSNGVTIPADTLVALPLCAIHEDEEIYPNSEEFDGFRFSKLREKEGDVAAAKHQAVTTSAELLAFGNGRHAW
ncbi:cytochrome P450 [Russula compacta]|nr:cytochrome P450 [Russula compacta]